MSDSSKLTENYANHPGYAFGAQPYSVDRSKIASFDEKYRQVASFGPGGRDALHAARAKLEALVQAIFGELRSQAVDQYETLFLQELEMQCLRELGEELDYYRSVGKAAFGARGQNEKVDALRSSRHFFGALSEAAVTEIGALGAPHVDIFRARAAAGRLTREDLSINAGSVLKKIMRVLNREFRKQGVLEAVSAYMSKAYHVGGLALELSVPQASWWRNTQEGVATPRTMYAHLDESIVYPKAIVYLTDVGPKNGPTTCYPRIYENLGLNALQEIIGRVLNYPCSREGAGLKIYYGAKYHQPMSSERFRRHFMRLPPELRFDSHMGWGVLAGSVLEREFLGQEKVMTGPPGSFIAFDGGKLFHRGGLLEEGERVVLQVIFSPVPSTWQRIASLPRRVLGKIRRMLK